MKNYWKIRIRRFLQNALRQIKMSKSYRFIMNLPYFLRVSFAILAVLYGCIALFTPLPLGTPAIIIAFAIVFGMKQTRIILMRVIAFLKIHIIFARISIWWHRWKRKKK